MSDDPQDNNAEVFDEDVVGRDDRVLSDEERLAFPPDELQGVPFSDADVTDESLAERARREEPEAWETPIRHGDDDRVVPAEEELGTIVEP